MTDPLKPATVDPIDPANRWFKIWRGLDQVGLISIPDQEPFIRLILEKMGYYQPTIGDPVNKEEKATNDKLSFAQLRTTNVARCGDVFHPLGSWSEADWACAAAGELGELCNLIKKRRRGETVSSRELEDELADTVIYLDLLAARMGIDLGLSIRRKFNEVSAKRGSSFFLDGVSP